MKTNKNLVLLGMMGSGKSTIGKILSKKTGYKFIDIDQKIEQKENSSIFQIFQIQGENYFRNLEQEMTLKYLNQKRAVISLGGGAFLNDFIRKNVLKNTISIWLNWDSNTLIKRIKNSNKRPITFSLNKFDIEKLIEERNKIYSKALFKLDCENLKKDEITNYIIKNFIK